MLDDIIAGRKKKLETLRGARINPYPSSVRRTIFIAEALKTFPSLLRAWKKVFVLGRIVGLRDQGNLLFLDVEDETGRMQAVLKKDNLSDFKTLKSALDIGDFIEVAGHVFKTKKGEKSIEARHARMVAKALRPLPSEWYGFSDTEERFRKRYLDTLLNADVRARFVKRAGVVRSIREFLHKENFMEVETPILQSLPGGARAKPFATHHYALDQDFYLRISPELYLKRLLIGGFEKIFEIGRNFRNEGIDHSHNPEFTMLELYWAYQNYDGLMKFTEKLLKKFIPGKWGKVTFVDAFKKFTGKSFENIDPSVLDEVFKKEVRPKIIKPTLVIDYPEPIMPLAKLHSDNPTFTQSFQLIVDGVEIVKGFSEMNDPLIQREQMERQERAFRGGDEEASRLDEEFLEALEYGMPPAAGLGMGIDRLVMYVTKTQNIKEVIAFPTLRSKE